jgi:hypothetical protein
LSALPLILEDGQWQDWIVPDDHPSRTEFQNLKIRWLAPLYEQQENDLKLLHAKQGIDVFVARYFVAQNQAGALFSYCVWGRGVDSLLPETGQVALFSQEGTPPIFVDWSIVFSLCGDLMQPTDDYPPRYRVTEFPGEVILRKLAASGL